VEGLMSLATRFVQGMNMPENLTRILDHYFSTYTSSRFNVWGLLCHVVLFTGIRVIVVAVSRIPPSPKYFSQSELIYIWTQIVVSGALLGCTVYFFCLLKNRLRDRREKKRASIKPIELPEQ
jgi:hypothetical protein